MRRLCFDKTLRAFMVAAMVGPVLSNLARAQDARSNGRAAGSKIHRAMQRALDPSRADEPVKAWILFRADKGLESTPALTAAVRTVAQTYDRRAIERRRLRRTRPGLFDLTDVPIPQEYIDSVAATGASVHVVSRWVNGVSVRATAAQLAQIAALQCVQKIQPVRRGRRIAPNVPPNAQSSTTSGGFYGESLEQLEQINLIELHDRGYTGAGVRIGILDTGFRRTHAAFNQPGHTVGVIAEYDFVDDDPETAMEPGDAPDQHSHGTLILGTLGAFRPGELVGAAYDAKFILCKTEDVTSETQVEEDNYVAGLEFIESHGGDVATASLTYSDWYVESDYDGLTAVTTVAVNIATGNGLHCCNAAGNSGHDSDPEVSHLGGAPADAMQVITCGAVSSSGAIAGFSSDGPTFDGRIKPEVLARGVDTRTVSSFDDVSYRGANGTSLSTPLVAGAVACLVQAHPDWTVDEMRSYLTENADYFVANGTFDPSYVRGYGILNAAAKPPGPPPPAPSQSWWAAMTTLWIMLSAGTVALRRMRRGGAAV